MTNQQMCIIKCLAGYKNSAAEISRFMNISLFKITKFLKDNLIVILNGKKSHGLSNTRIYKIWKGIKKRCFNINDSAYYNYGERGVTICFEWDNDFMLFYNWSLENGYTDELSIDRIDNDGNYCPENCRWADRKAQNNNTRSNHKITAFGETKNISEWIEDERCHISYDTLRARLKYGIDEELSIVTSSNVKKLRRNSNLIEAFNEEKTVTEWSEDPRCIVTANILFGRLRRGNNPEIAMTTPQKRFHGETS